MVRVWQYHYSLVQTLIHWYGDSHSLVRRLSFTGTATLIHWYGDSHSLVQRLSFTGTATLIHWYSDSHSLVQRLSFTGTVYAPWFQIPGSKFNRAMLMNIGFIEAMKLGRYDCVIFHDVDLLPENDQNIYQCPEENARHMSVAIDKFKYA